VPGGDQLAVDQPGAGVEAGGGHRAVVHHVHACATSGDDGFQAVFEHAWRCGEGEHDGSDHTIKRTGGDR
jgi:hypothetical protein